MCKKKTIPKLLFSKKCESGQLFFTLRSVKRNGIIYFVLFAKIKEEIRLQKTPLKAYIFCANRYLYVFENRHWNQFSNLMHDCYFLFHTFFYRVFALLRNSSVTTSAGRPRVFSLHCNTSDHQRWPPSCISSALQLFGPAALAARTEINVITRRGPLSNICSQLPSMKLYLLQNVTAITLCRPNSVMLYKLLNVEKIWLQWQFFEIRKYIIIVSFFKLCTVKNEYAGNFIS